MKPHGLSGGMLRNVTRFENVARLQGLHVRRPELAVARREEGHGRRILRGAKKTAERLRTRLVVEYDMGGI